MRRQQPTAGERIERIERIERMLAGAVKDAAGADGDKEDLYQALDQIGRTVEEARTMLLDLGLSLRPAVEDHPLMDRAA
jgi:hypothetical protein